MIYLTLFDTHDAYESVKDGLSVPNISRCLDDTSLHYRKRNYRNEYFTMIIKSRGTIAFTASSQENVLYYSKDFGSTWTATLQNVDIPVQIGDRIIWKGTPTPISQMGIGTFNPHDVEYDVEGNIMSLLYGNDFKDKVSLSGKNYAFSYLFNVNRTLNSCKNLILPATTLSSCCYLNMFHGCENIKVAPELPATTTAQSCYSNMFNGCTKLAVAPELPATTLSQYCYENMFYGCTSLKESPTLPAKTLQMRCYYGMFYGCVALTTAGPILATTLANYCCSGMFRNCMSLKVAPTLLAKTLKTSCYGYMFYGCSVLNTVVCLATNPSDSYTENWLDGVYGTGSFTKSIDSTGWLRGPSYIPANWQVYTDKIEAPIVSCNGKKITITCNVAGATIYYKLNNTGSFLTYTSPIEISADTVIDTYAELGDKVSNTVTLTCIYDPTHYYEEDYLTLVALTSGTIIWKHAGSNAKTISYSTNNGTSWTSITSTTSGITINVNQGDKVLFKGENTRYSTDKNSYAYFDGTATFDAEGNIMSLLYGDNFINNISLGGTNWVFCLIFKQSKVVSAEHLVLPAMTLTESCYRAMFSKCPNLTTAPQLPATTLGNNCYWYMFEECPITTAPDLPATTLVAGCYGQMFLKCTNLNYIKCLATSGFNANNALTNWVSNVAATGTFVKDTNTTWSTGNSGIPSGWTVQDAT